MGSSCMREQPGSNNESSHCSSKTTLQSFLSYYLHIHHELESVYLREREREREEAEREIVGRIDGGRERERGVEDVPLICHSFVD